MMRLDKKTLTIRSDISFGRCYNLPVRFADKATGLET